MARGKLFFLSLIFVILVSVGVVLLNGQKPGKPKEVMEEDRAVMSSKALFAQRIKDGWDMSTGPCLTNDLMPGWVADVVHSPRQAIDEIASNQCAAYREKRAKHFVELDTSGNLVRVR